MSSSLVFLYEAPLAAFGGMTTGERRSSEGHPGRSAVAGMVACAMGFTREDPFHRELAKQFYLAVASADAGRAKPSRILDFHTTQGTRSVERRDWLKRHGRDYRNRTEEIAAAGITPWSSTTSREYVTDARFLVQMRFESEDLAERCRTGLDRPKQAVFAGRRSNPFSSPFSPVVVKGGVLRAFDEHPGSDGIQAFIAWDASIEEDALIGVEETSRQHKRDVPGRPLERDFVTRVECIGHRISTATRMRVVEASHDDINAFFSGFESEGNASSVADDADGYFGGIGS